MDVWIVYRSATDYESNGRDVVEIYTSEARANARRDAGAVGDPCTLDAKGHCVKHSWGHSHYEVAAAEVIE